MAKKIDMETEFATLPDVPEGFEKWCYSYLENPRIYYKRHGKIADCFCAECGKKFVTEKIPVKGGIGECPHCHNKGEWEWERITRVFWEEYSVMLLQKTSTQDLVARMYWVTSSYDQGRIRRKECEETKRYFLHMGDVSKFHFSCCWGKRGWEKRWGTSSNGQGFQHDYIYPGWQQAIRESNLKYAEEFAVKRVKMGEEYPYSVSRTCLIKALCAYASNPAVEMYEKSGMTKLVDHIIRQDGKTRLVNRRAKTALKQLRLRDKAMLNELIRHKGDPILLEILQTESKSGTTYTEEQRHFLRDTFTAYRGKENINYLLRYMTLQKLMNRLEKYAKQENTRCKSAVITEYTDYLKMREELGYDMTNELYIYPKNLKEKHDQMVKERNAKRDELHIEKMKQKYPKIEERYQALYKKYAYECEGYLIRPAKDAGEIVMEGRILHHCVGGDTYLGRHDRGKTTILFLRKSEEPDTPYYTIEIRGKEILQWYGIRDTKPDKEIIGPWLDAYVEHLAAGRKKKDKGVETHAA